MNTADDLDVCLDLGVTAVISDRPAYMLELLGVQPPSVGGGADN